MIFQNMYGSVCLQVLRHAARAVCSGVTLTEKGIL